MNEILQYVGVFISGLFLGLFFFGGLWFTVKKTLRSKTPALWVLVSFVFRISIVLLGFYYLASGNWQRLLFCLSGFIIAKYGVVYFTKSLEAKQGILKNGGSNEA